MENVAWKRLDPRDVMIKRGVSVQADGLQEAPDDLQQDTVELLRVEHLREMERIRQQHRDEVGPALGHQPFTASRCEQPACLSPRSQESAQRQQLLRAQQEERARLQAAHAAQLDNLRLQLDTQIREMKLEHALVVRLGPTSDPRPGASVAEEELFLSRLLPRNRR